MTVDRLPIRTHVEPRLWTRIRYGWTAGMGMLFTALMSPGVVLHTAVRPGAETFVRWMRPWSRAILTMSRIRLDVDQRAAVPEPAVFVANHQNSLDIVALSASIPTPFVFVAKTELRRWPFVGWVLDRTDCLFLDRSTPRKALKSLMSAAGKIRGGASVLLFPEGGRSWRHGLLPFMKGPFVLAIESGVPVVPVALVGNMGVIDEVAHTAQAGAVRVVIGEPIPTDGLARGEAEALGERVRAWIEAELARAGPLVGPPESP